MTQGLEHAARTASKHVWLAEAHLQFGRMARGIEELDNAARALAAARDDRAYVDVARRILALQPNRVDMWRGLAYAQLRWGDTEGAGEAVVQWMRLRPGSSEAIECMAEVFGRRGRRTQAAQTLARLGLRELVEGRIGTASRLCERARSWKHDEPDVATLASELSEVAAAAAANRFGEEMGLTPRPRRVHDNVVTMTAAPRQDANADVFVPLGFAVV